MDARQYAASTTQLRRHCDKLLDAGYHCAFVHALPNGALAYYGSTVSKDLKYSALFVLNELYISDLFWVGKSIK